MNASSLRTVAWLSSRLEAPRALASRASPACFPILQFQCRPVVTAPKDNSGKPTASASSARAVPFSTATLEEEESDDEEHPAARPLETMTSRPQNGATSIPRNGLSRKAAILKCTCGYQDQKDVQDDHIHEPLPPPLPKPVYSVHKRVLPSNLTALSAPEGRRYLHESMTAQMAESYWALTEQFVNQSDPAYCGVTTLLMTLNAMNVDPNIRWKGGWRYYADEDILLSRCCLNAERIRRVGITMEQFMILGTCHGMRITMKRPAVGNTPQSAPKYFLEDFRADIRRILDSRVNDQNSVLVTSFSRSALQQTGDGHFSPIAAYHEESDQVLVLDVARFKYAPYWVGVEELFRSMEPLDPHTDMPRGWYIMSPPAMQQHTNSYKMASEDRRPAHLVPESHEQEACPVGKIKVQFCPAKAAVGESQASKDQ